MEPLANVTSPWPVLHFLEGIDFPARKHDLVLVARLNGAPKDVVGALSHLPGRDIASVEDLVRSYPHLKLS